MKKGTSKPTYNQSIRNMEKAFDESIITKDPFAHHPETGDYQSICDLPLAEPDDLTIAIPMQEAIRDLSQLLAWVKNKKLTYEQKLLLAYFAGTIVVPLRGDYDAIKQKLNDVFTRRPAPDRVIANPRSDSTR